MKVDLNAKTHGPEGTVHVDVGLDDGRTKWYAGTLGLRPGLVQAPRTGRSTASGSSTTAGA